MLSRVADLCGIFYFGNHFIPKKEIRAMRNIAAILILSLVSATLSFPAEAGSFRYKQAVRETPRKIEPPWFMFEAERKKVVKKWPEYIHSNTTEWVSYTEEQNTRSQVNFKKGFIVIEVVVADSAPDALKKAEKEIATHAVKVFSETDYRKKPILNRQVKNKKGVLVGTANLDKFVNEELISSIKIGKSFRSRDGHSRKKFSVAIPMIPNHLLNRVKKYLPIIRKNALRFNLELSLVLAVIHTESHFNPRAVSHCNAVGMMQVIPRFAGLEAQRLLYKQNRIVTRDYLFDPENNVESGCAYLYLLKNKYFNKITDSTKNNYVAICGYNWGPTSLRKKGYQHKAGHFVNSRG